MEILFFLLFISLMLVLAALLLFLFSVDNRDLHRTEQISLLPFEDEQHANKNRCL